MVPTKVSRRAVLRLLRELLRQLAEVRGYDTEQLSRLSLRSFYAWLQNRSEKSYEQLCRKLRLPPETWVYFYSSLANPFTFVDLVYPLWKNVKKFSPQPRRTPTVVYVQIVLAYADDEKDRTGSEIAAALHTQLEGGEAVYVLRHVPGVTVVVGNDDVDLLTTHSCIDMALEEMRKTVYDTGLHQLQPE